nr:hypothetical protein [candidate division Zixibacteria bacterium]
GIYSGWIDKSIAKLAEVFPALYARPEQHSDFIVTIDTFRYAPKRPEKTVEAEASPENTEDAPVEDAPQEAETASTEDANEEQG